MTDDLANEIPSRPVFGRTTSIVLVAVAALLFAWFLRSAQPPRQNVNGGNTEHLGQAFPEIVVEGWLNGPGPTPDELAGKICVVEAWAFWCGPCVHAAPHLRKLYDEYHPRGVVFIGLTKEGERNLDRSRQFLEKAQITWPNGYGADRPLAALYPEGMGIPNLWVLDRQGQIAWEGHPLELPEDLLAKMLKQ